jgi:hypothetical protein
MVGKGKTGRFTLKKERELIAMVASGATVSEAAAKFRTKAKTVERKAKALGIRLKGDRGEIGLKGKPKG